MTKDLQETSRVNAAADGAHVRQAIQSVSWEHRGIFQRLVRVNSRDDATVRRRGT
jgi:hypothetical protein